MKSVRLFFKKKGRMKFTSHLDITRFMARLIVKSKIPVWYTEGFNQHIYMNFALPLSLGFESNYEIMDIKLTDDTYPLEKCLEAMKKASPPDIIFFDCCEPLLHTKEICSAEYILTLHEGGEVVAQGLKEFLKRDSIICSKKGKKGKVKEIDLIPKVYGCSFNGANVTLLLSAGIQDTLNPSLLMEAFFEQMNLEPTYYSVLRTNVFDKNGLQFR